MVRLTVLLALLLGGVNSLAVAFDANKLYAGAFNDPELVLATIRASDPEVDDNSTVIPCEPKINYGVAFVLDNREKQASGRSKLKVRLQHPHLELRGSTERWRGLNVRLDGAASDVVLLDWRLRKSELRDGDFRVSVYDGDAGILSHTFKVRGCSDGTLASMIEKPRYVCRRIKSTGTRIPKTICKTPSLMELEREVAKRQLERARRSL